MKQKPIELDELTQRRHELARLLGEHRRTPGGTLTAEARRWLELEQGHYAKSTDNDLATWQAARARIEAIDVYKRQRLISCGGRSPRLLLLHHAST